MKHFIALFLSIFSAATLFSQDLETGFIDPPGEAKPRTWWHWTNSNVTKDGITKDLEWMKRVGIGGMMLADVAAGAGQTVETKIPFRSPEWYDAVKHTAAEASRLGLEMTVFSSAGWSLTGGPWVKPEQAMKKLVWSETDVTGPKEFAGALPSPPDVEGPIGNLTRGARPAPGEQKFYRDFVVLAFPVPGDESGEELPVPVATTGSGKTDPSAFLDADLNSSAMIRAGKDKSRVWLQYRFPEPVTVRAITLANRAGIPVGTLKAGNEENMLETVLHLPGAQLYRSGKVATYSFPEISASVFLLEFTGGPMRPGDVMAEMVPKVDSVYTFGEIKLHRGARVNRWEDKAGFYHLFNYEPVASDEVSSISIINKDAVVDITKYMGADGTLKWKVPAGKWKIMRFGYSLTGARNRPSVPAGSGLETDKLSREHIEAYIKNYTEPLKELLGPMYGKVLSGMMFDSWEAGMQNWTDNMLAGFLQRRGYDLKPYLPCLAGRIVGSSEISDRVLWDFRRTLADMYAENHYAVLTEYLNKQGIKTYGEASGVSLEILEDALLCKKYVDYPMGEFWFRALHPELMYYQDVRGAASASHVYGKKITAAESFTGGGYESPRTLKSIGDYWLAQGVNRFVFHTSAHQPLDTKPGNTMVGTHINRNITWAEQAGSFMTYLSRCSWMLQQGKFVADIAYLLDESAPSTMPIWGTGLNPAPPEGYDYDYINVDVLINRMTVKDGRLVLPDGLSYAVLVLPQTRSMSLPVLNKIHQLVGEGATVIGPKPECTPGLTGYPGSEKLLKNTAGEIWADLDGISRTRRAFGKGMIAWGAPVEAILKLKGIEPDLRYDKPAGSEIYWIHRQSEDADIYFIANASEETVTTRIDARVQERKAGLWDPVTGRIRSAEVISASGRSAVAVTLEKRQSLFLVFRNVTDVTNPGIAGSEARQIAINGPWKVSFPPDLGAPEIITMDTLKSLTLNSDEGVRFFSGTATYTAGFEVDKKTFASSGRYIIDIGRAGDIAEVFVNGKQAGILWTNPYELDITGLVARGKNTLEVKVTNQWTNRIAGDRTASKKILNANMFVRPGPLPESGLIGPVVINVF